MNVLLSLACLCGAAAADAPAADDAAVERPYRVVICLRTTDNPILTPLFARAVQRAVQDQLRNYFGPLADIDVRTADHWLLDEFPHGDITQPELTPQRLAAEKVQEKLFLVVLDYREARYQIAWRQADGQLGQVGPICRRSTPDRQWVAKAVCLAIKDDFAAVADVEPGKFPETVTVKFRGREYKEQLADLLGERCVLQPFWVLRVKDRVERRAIPNTLLYVERSAGLHQAKVVTNLPNPWPQRAVIAGYEAIKVPTQAGRIRLHLVDAETGAPAVDCTVQANDQGFDRLGPADLLDQPSRDGFVLSEKTYRDVAYVKVTHGSAAIKLPLLITGELCERVVKVQVDRAAGAKNEFQRTLRFLLEDAQTIQAMQADAVREFNDLNKNKRYEEALKRVQATIEFVEPRLRNVYSVLNQLRDQARQLKDSGGTLLELAGRQVQQADERIADLLTLKQSLDNAIQKRDAQARANVLIKLGQQAERDGDIDEALTRYRLALSEQPDQPELAQKVEQMQQDWTVKNPAHQEARTLICERWAKAEVTDIEALLPAAEKAFATLQANSDHLTARRLLSANSANLSRVNGLIEQLSDRGDAADQPELDKYAGLVERIADFQTKVSDYLDKVVSEGGPAAEKPGPAPPAEPAKPAPGPAKAAPEATPPGPETPEEKPPPGPAAEEKSPPGPAPAPPTPAEKPASPPPGPPPDKPKPPAEEEEEPLSKPPN